MNRLDQRSYFFDAGIRFECRRCGACCTGDPGVVRVNEQEIAEIAAYLVPIHKRSFSRISAIVERFYHRDIYHTNRKAVDGADQEPCQEGNHPLAGLDTR